LLPYLGGDINDIAITLALQADLLGDYHSLPPLSVVFRG
jgi:hypothetical protein